MLAWTLFGGIFGGGLLIGAHALSGRGTPGLYLLLAPVLFVLGTLLGALHGLALSFMGRGRDVARSQALRRAAAGAGVGLLFLPASWLISAAIVVGVALQSEMRLSWLVVSAGGTLLGMMVGVWACSEGCSMLRAAYRRRQAPPIARPAGELQRPPGR